MIDYLIHVYKRGTAPFRSLSALPEAEAIQTMQALYVEGSVFWERFENPVQYLQIRRQVEQWLCADFVAKGGVLRAPYPIYMIYGRSRWIRTMIDAATLATTTEIEIPFSIFRECDVSFTYPDSMVSFMLAAEKNPAYYSPEYHGKVFTLSEILLIVETQGLPGERWGTELPGHLANYIEAQVWNHEPLLAYVKEHAGGRA